MSDFDSSSGAWRTPPSVYLATRPATYALPEKPTSVYVEMRDGCKLAVDVYLPQILGDAAVPEKLPTVVIFTPYYRRFVATEPDLEPSPNCGRYRDMFVPRGYAVVVVDVRGTGASFGTRDALRSPKEREDYFEVAQWIVSQPWSDGLIGSTGISYLGAAVDFHTEVTH